jgi:ankyrin repeat protein
LVSKTRMTDWVKQFRWRDVRSGLDENPRLRAVRDRKGRNWLHLCGSVDVAARPGLDPKESVKLAQVLLEKGIDINEAAFREGSWKATALWYSIAWGRNLRLARHLLKRGSDPNHCMWAAAYNRDVEAIRLLAGNGADVDPGTETPFLFAVRWSRFEAAEELLKQGADVNTRNKKKMTALHYMLKKGSDKKHLRTMIRYGARGDVKDAGGATAAEIMMRKRDPEFHAMAEELSME